MIADALTKEDLGKSNGALEELLCTGKFCIWDEEDELARRKANPVNKNRSRKASEAIRNGNIQFFSQLHSNKEFGELLKYATMNHSNDDMLQ